MRSLGLHLRVQASCRYTLGPRQRACLATALLALLASRAQSCTAEEPAQPGGTGGSGAATGGRASGGAATGGSGPYVVALIQSSKTQAADLTQDDVTTMVSDAVTLAGGFDFIQDGQTVVLKPNLLTPYASCWSGGAANPATVNGVTTDWRVTRAVADLVRARNPGGEILVMEGSAQNTTTAFSLLGYTSANFGTSVDEFIPFEGTSCINQGANYRTGLVQRRAASGTTYWVNQRYLEAQVVISIAALKTHAEAGTTGCVKNLGIGATPASQYSVSTSATDCGRNKTQPTVAGHIDHSRTALAEFIRDYYSLRPADFAVIDGLQGLQNGPCSTRGTDRMNMRLILAARNAVALDAIQALVVGCNPTAVPHLTLLESAGFGTTNAAVIGVVGNRQVADVARQFAGPSWACGSP